MKKYILVILLLSGCAPSMNKWVGSTQQQLTATKGYEYPFTTLPDGNNGNVLIYSQYTTIPGHSYVTYSSSGQPHYNYVPSTNSWEFKLFFVDANGKIYKCLHKGSMWPPQKTNFNRWIKPKKKQ